MVFVWKSPIIDFFVVFDRFCLCVCMCAWCRQKLFLCTSGLYFLKREIMPLPFRYSRLLACFSILKPLIHLLLPSIPLDISSIALIIAIATSSHKASAEHIYTFKIPNKIVVVQGYVKKIFSCSQNLRALSFAEPIS